MHSEKFQQFYRMPRDTFRNLLAIGKPLLQQKDTSYNYRKFVSTEEGLFIFPS